MERLEQNRYGFTIHLTSQDKNNRFRMQITGSNPLTNDSAVYIHICDEFMGRINGMAGASGTLLEDSAATKPPAVDGKRNE